MEEQNHGHSHSHGGDSPSNCNRNDDAKKMSSEDDDSEVFAADKRDYDNAITKLITVMCLSVIFITAQMIGGYLSNSIAIFTDCAHLATDMIGFMMSMLAMRISLNPSTEQMTFGWHRAEVIGTLMSVAFLVIVTVWLVVEATERFINPTPVEPVSMLITAVGSIVMNLIMIQILHSGDNPYHLGGGSCDHSHSHGEGENHGHSHSHGGDNDEESKKEGEDTQIEESKDEDAPLLAANNIKKQEPPKPKQNLNIDAAYLHILGDLLMSVAVLIAAVIIYFQPTWTYADPICTYIFSVICCFTVVDVIKQCLEILMEAAPRNVDIKKIIKDLRNIEDVISIHDFHLWQISTGKTSMTSHIMVEKNPMKVLQEAQRVARDNHNLDHCTFQIEDSTEMNCKCSQTMHTKLKL